MGKSETENLNDEKIADSYYLLIEAPLTDSSLIRDKRLKEVLEFWERNKRGDNVPLWKCFNPMQFTDILPTISVFSNEGTLEEPDYLLRVEGDQSAELMKLPTSMTKVEKAEGYFSKTRLRKLLDLMARTKKPTYFIRNMGWNDDRHYINYEILSLPFSSRENGPVDRFLSAKVFHRISLED
ncbi:hypothetical protein [Emcibacter sp.]|uniref:hypothetical protein n=1 Tax=Emcibacter sp. TaxID=1979954 RepID=UPI002AA940A8|nr:hypothetical protein [Emcibacter sp.]